MSDKKKKKKHWYEIDAGKQFNDKKLGESRAYNSQDLLGKVLRVNLMSLTNEPKSQYITLYFKVKNVTNNGCSAEIIDYKINNAHIKRLTRKTSNKLEDSFLVKSKDGVSFKIKPLILTKYKSNKSALTALRLKAREFVTDFFSRTDSSQVFSSIIYNKLQMELKKNIRKIFPVAICEVKSCKIL